MKNHDFELKLYAHAACVRENMSTPFEKEMEDFIMKNKTQSLKTVRIKKVFTIVAVAAVFLLGSTAFAGGVLTGWHSYSEKEYSSIPSEQEYIADVGYAPVLIQEFENGYCYKTGYVVYNEHADSKTGEVDKFKSAMFEYENNGELLYFWQEKSDSISLSGAVVDRFAGVDIYYSSYMNKIVPEDYQMTEADKAAEEKGELVFSWGSDSVRTMEVKNTCWEKDGVSYMLLQTGGELTEDDMISMAKQAIAN